ncbi:hypothetical protein DTO282E5_6313 [Paecilomyces variotii]|nr:hypothetical protein DTO282E5_6313 [Paecilomyces variotii]
MDAPKRVVLRLRSNEFDNGSPQEIVKISHKFLESSGYNKTGRDNHFVHAEPPQPEPRRHFHITLDINYRNNTPDMQTLPFEFFRVNKNLEFKPLELGPLETQYRQLLNGFYPWGRDGH